MSPTVAPLTTLVNKLNTRSSLWRRLEKKWNEVQVGRQGSYSVERLESLDYYCKTTSRTRVVMVCILTPIPALTSAILLECLPLCSPSEGWMANWVYWARFGTMHAMLGLVGNAQTGVFIPGLNFTVFKNILVSVGATMGSVGTCILVARSIGFPVPFMTQLVTITVMFFMPIMFRVVMGKAMFTKGSPVKAHFDRFQRFFVTYMAFCVVYPLYKVLYNSVPVSYRGAVVVILPVWRFATKSVVVRATRELEDCMPQLVAMSVDLFSTLFISVCMSTSGSLYLSMLFIAGDIAQSLLEFRELRENADILVQLVGGRRATRKRMTPAASNNVDLLSIILDVARNPRDCHVTSLECTRLWACLPHPLTIKQEEQLLALEASGVYTRKERPYSTAPSNHQNRGPHRLHMQIIRRVSVRPGLKPIPNITEQQHLKTSALPATIIQQNPSNSGHAHKSKSIVEQGLQLLFHCEYLVLVEYVECIVPLVFVAFKSILQQLPSIIYYPGGADSWSTQAATNILVFTLFEIGSLALFSMFIQRKFDFSPLYQLAFVLETQFYAAQTCLFVEILNLLQYELLHLGADFTLRFEWFRDK